MTTVIQEKCSGCGSCIGVCPTDAIRLVGSCASIDQSLCHDCGACECVCPAGAIRVIPLPAPVIQGQAVLPAKSSAVVKVASASSWRQRLLPVLASAAACAGRELLPLALEALTTRARNDQGPAGLAQPAAMLTRGGGQRHRWRLHGRRN
ncbi:MAG: DUF362 domain-containing protein [Anaerolineae bacterium]